MSTVTDVLDEVPGLRDDAARTLAEQYPDVTDLAAARKTDLQAVDGVGPVMASRILEAARGADAPTAETAETADLPARMKTAIADAADAAKPMLSVVESTARETAGTAETGDTAPAQEPTADAGRPDEDVVLAPVVERLAALIGTAAGWTIRAYRTVAAPAHRALDGLLRRTRRA